MLVRPVCNIIILILSIQPLLADGYRRLHGVDGGEVVAEVLAVKEGVVTLRRQDGQVFKTPIDQFAEKDRQYLLGLDPRFRRSLIQPRHDLIVFMVVMLPRKHSSCQP